jgi:hypothetical protein
MKRLIYKNKKFRKNVDYLKTKVSNYLEDFLPKNSFTKFSNVCVFSSYSKVIYRKYHMSGKFLKIFFREGLIYGIQKKSF